MATKIEDRIDTIDDVKEMTTTVAEGVASVTIEFNEGVDIDEKVAEVKREVDALMDLPEESDRIVVQKIEPNLPTINVSLFGDVDDADLEEMFGLIAEQLDGSPFFAQLLNDVCEETLEHVK